MVLKTLQLKIENKNTVLGIRKYIYLHTLLLFLRFCHLHYYVHVCEMIDTWKRGLEDCY